MERRKKTIAEVREELQENIRCGGCDKGIASDDIMYKLSIDYDVYWCGNPACASKILNARSTALDFDRLVAEARAKS